LAGTSFANRAPISDFVAQEAAVGAGEFLYFSAETITLTAVLNVTGNSKRFVGVNATTGAIDGSLAILDAANLRAYCIEAHTYNYCHYRHIEFIRATTYGLRPGSYGGMYNCSFRNNAGGAYQNDHGTYLNCKASNNTGYGIIANGNGDIGYCQVIGNARGVTMGLTSIVNSVVHNNSVHGIAYCTNVDGCVIDGNGKGIDNGSNYNAQVTRCSITNNTTGIQTNATGTSWVWENQNYFYNNTAKFGGTTSAIYSLGDSIDGASDPYTSLAGDDFTPAVAAEMINTVYRSGMSAEATNIQYLNAGLNPEIPSAAAPTFAGITKFEILSNNKFYVEWAAGTGTITSYDIYIRNATNPFSSTYLAMRVKSTVTSTIVHLQGDSITLLQGGTTYYCGVRADNCGSSDSNVVELSNVCSGAELIQRMTVTQPVISL
jgi:hypothetical protein